MNDRKLETQVKNKKHAFAKQDEISNGQEATEHAVCAVFCFFCLPCI